MLMYEATPRTIPSRSRERASYDTDVVHAILDEALVCHLSFVVDGMPRVLPTLHVRVDDTLYVHASTGSRPLLLARSGGLPVSIAVTLIDGLVLARSQFHHSVNYRSVVAHGLATLVEEETRQRAVLTALMEKVAVGRAADTRPPNAQELAKTAVLALPLVEVSAKTRSGGVNEEPEDYALPHWAGVIPIRTERGTPEPDEGVVGVPAYLI
jgi:nitroimidazol reductase NimA-like FMN-containing flavoprotein (pyridoxamine 5'-phosphate oxidase superfamily)